MKEFEAAVLLITEEKWKLVCIEAEREANKVYEQAERKEASELSPRRERLDWHVKWPRD